MFEFFVVIFFDGENGDSLCSKSQRDEILMDVQVWWVRCVESDKDDAEKRCGGTKGCC